MLDAYYDAFSHYLRSGDSRALADYCHGDAELAFLAVYRNGYLKACSDVLRSSFPSVAQLVGETCFTALAHRYVDTHPPPTASLAGYGEHFARLIEELSGVHGLDYLACVAKLDRAWTEAYFAANAHTVDKAHTPHADLLAGMTADAMLELRCRLAPCARLVSLQYTVLDAWARLRRGALRMQTQIRRSPQQVLIWRRFGDISFRALGGAEHAFVAGIAAGGTCADAALGAVDLDPHFDVAAGFASLLHERLLVPDHEQQQGGS